MSAESEPGARAPDDPGASASRGLIWLAGPLGLVLLGGLVMPLHHGVLVPLLVGGAMAVIADRRVRGLVRAQRARRRPTGEGRAVVVLVAALGAVAVLMTVLARGVGTLLVAFPAALWGLGAALLAALLWAGLGARLGARAQPVVLLGLGLVVPAAGVYGTRYEASFEDARGWAHSGPLLGIHPFQVTAVMVDGEGPFDLPINDYVEPDGSRGYGPEALAEALDRALAAIADAAYPEGPARIRRALIDAEVEAVRTAPVHERLDRPPFAETQPRLLVRSGSFGRGSRVEFVCPGRRIDPRGPQGESVMNRMCPGKYASEGSAGLGVTGRWSGYVEGRGNARVGLFRLGKWTRSGDAEGQRVIERETEIWSRLALLLAALALVGPTRHAGEGLRGLAGGLGVIAVLALLVLSLSADGVMAVGMIERAPAWRSWLDPRAWVPALALAGVALYAVERSPGGGEAPRRWIAVPAMLVVVTTLAVAGSLPALEWIITLPGAESARWPRFVRGVAEAVGERGGLTIFEVEGVVASALATLLLGGLLATGRAGLAAWYRLAPAGWGRGPTVIGMILVFGVAAALVVSRKTAGAAALVPGAIGMTLVLGSGIVRLLRSSGEGSPVIGVIAHLAWMAVGGVLVWISVAPLPSGGFVTLYTVVGVVLVLAAGLTGALAPPGDATPDREPPA